MSETETQQAEDRNGWDVPKVRKCLTCQTKFESAWSGERICKRCKSSSAWRSGSGAGTFSSGRS